MKYWAIVLATVILLCGAVSVTLHAVEPVRHLGTSKSAYGELKEGNTRNPLLAIGEDPFTSDLDLSHVAKRLAAVQEGGGLTFRGPREASIYAKASAAVVLIIANDGIGSGSIISKDGTILTNWHVIAGQQDIGIIFKPVVEGAKVGRKDVRRGVVVKYDQVADLALVKVAEVPAHVQPLALGASSEIQIGSDVHAIGHPTGETWTYTKGLISQIRRGYEWATSSRLKHRADVIQTQTPINPGNSGGPLISEKGLLIGINSFKAEGEALNFAVSVDEVRRFLSQSGNRLAEPEAIARRECKVRELKRGRNRSNDADVIWYDLNCDGVWDAFLTTPDDRREPVTMSIDSKDVGKIDIIIVDEDRDGRWDYSLHDVDGDGKADLIGFHPDGKLKASRFEPYVASR